MRMSGRMVNTPEGISVYMPNDVVNEKKDFYISYCASVRDYGCPTTAIVYQGKYTVHKILCGDHVEQLKDCATLEEALIYFESIPEQHHSFSESEEELEKFYSKLREINKGKPSCHYITFISTAKCACFIPQ